jgi:Protein-L-isoaspartate(D-aspartate) O-methyltransferase (PCMT)
MASSNPAADHLLTERWFNEQMRCICSCLCNIATAPAAHANEVCMAQASQPDLLEGDPPAVTIRAGNALGSILGDTDAQVGCSWCTAADACKRSEYLGQSYVTCIRIVHGTSCFCKTDIVKTLQLMVLRTCVQYDAIHVGAAAASMPEKLIQKLAPGGRMVCHRSSWGNRLL